MPNNKNQLPETLTWKALSHVRQQRSHLWYLGFTVIAIGLIAFAIYDRSIITMITFALIIFIVFAFSNQPPRETTYKITKTGIAVDAALYPYRIIKFFWIVYNPPDVKTLNLQTSAYLNNRIVVQLGSEDPITIKLVLSQYLREDLDRQEDLTEALSRRLKI